MNLKRIVREEMDDIWQHLTQGEPNIWISYQVLVFDEEPTKEEVIKFIKDAFKSGLVKNDAIRTWELEGIEDEAETIYEYSQKDTHPYLRIDLNNGWLYYGEYYSNIDSKSSELKTIKFSEAKNYLMRESEEEEDVWRWAKETNIDLPETEKDLKNFIGWSFVWDTDMENHTGMWGYNGKEWKITQLELGEVWFRDQNSGVDHVENVDRFLTRIGEGSWVLVSPEGYLLDPQYNRTYNKNINESTGLEWIMDEDPTEIIFQPGDRVTVHNMGDESGFEEWLGMFSNNYKSGNYGENITGVVMDNNYDEDEMITSFSLEEKNTGDRIYFPYKRKAGWEGLNIIYEPII